MNAVARSDKVTINVMGGLKSVFMNVTLSHYYVIRMQVKYS